MKSISKRIRKRTIKVDYKQRHDILQTELEELREVLRAIQNGEVDALVVNGNSGERIFTLKSADQPYRILVENMNEGAITLNQEGVLFFTNKTFSEMIQREPEDLLGKSILEILEDGERPSFVAAFEEGKRGKSKHISSLLNKAGKVVPCQFSMTAVEMEEGFGVSAVVSDLTNRIQFEKSRFELEGLKNERELRERFVSVLAHDLRNPLSVAKTGAQMLMRYPDQLDHAVYGKRITDNIERVDKMIQNLLDANRIRAGKKLPIQVDKCDLVGTVAETLKELSLVLGDRFVMKSNKEKIMGFWSSDQLKRVLENLATNAVKYGASQKNVTVGLSEKGGTVALSVHNFGNPLSKYETDNLFKPYARAQSAETGSQPGWGLGLTLVSGVTEAHGGKVTVHSDPKKGTTFTVTLPIDARSKEKTADSTVSV